jgi:putative DNA primase/helicase
MIWPTTGEPLIFGPRSLVAELLDHSPDYFNQTAVPLAYQEAEPPERWLGFLHDLWGDDHEQIQALQEWFGYVISGRLDLHKILLLIGPPRAGKGIITRILTRLLGGPGHVAGTTPRSLNNEFGLAPVDRQAARHGRTCSNRGR